MKKNLIYSALLILVIAGIFLIFYRINERKQFHLHPTGLADSSISDLERLKQQIPEINEDVLENVIAVDPVLHEEMIAPDVVFCPMDVQLCADGTYVSRVAPDCNFMPCPEMDIDPTWSTPPDTRDGYWIQ